MSLDHVTATSRPRHGSPGTDGEAERDAKADTSPRRRRTRGRRLVAATALLAGVAVPAAIVAAREESRGDGDDGTATTTTVPIEARDLVLTDEYEGELGFGETEAVTAGRAGVVTGATPVGTTVGQGDVLFDLDLQPTVLVHGDIPAFRDLDVDADPGADVTQLEQALVDLGFGESLTVDDDFTDATAEAVTDWEESLGRADPDGVVTLGDVVFAPTDLRIDEVSADTGTQVPAGDDVVQVTATSKVVTLALSVSEAAEVEAGTPVDVVLPDESEATGTIADVASEPSTDDGGDPTGGGGGDGGDGGEETYPVTVELDDPALADAFDSGTVEVSVERDRTEDATAVPVIALLALAEGGYALQIVDESRPEGHELVAVEVGTIADDWVEVSGDGIESDVEVVVPA